MIGINLKKNWEHKMIDVNEISKMAYNIAEKRYKSGAFGNHDNSVQNLLKHCAGEVIEAMNAFDDWQEDLRFGAVSMGVTDPDWNKETPKEKFVGELADVIMCVLIIAGKMNLDIEKAIVACGEKNYKRANGNGDKL